MNFNSNLSSSYQGRVSNRSQSIDSRIAAKYFGVGHSAMPSETFELNLD